MISEEKNTIEQFELQRQAVATAAGPKDVVHLRCTALTEAGFVNAFSTRQQGISSLPNDALNLAYQNDADDNVTENRKIFLEATHLAGYRIVTMEQTHSANVDVLKSGLEAGAESTCDALMAAQSMTLLGVKTADCLPILIGDKRTGVFAAVHAGWRGTSGRIAEKALLQMIAQFGVEPKQCVVAFGPSACGDCFEIGNDVIGLFRKAFPDWPTFVKPISNASALLDIRLANARQLIDQGIPEDQIHIATYCTMHQNDLFFSYRKEGATVGRQLSIVGKRSRPGIE